MLAHRLLREDAPKVQNGGVAVPDVRWLDEPEPHNFPAALDYLSLVFDELAAHRIVEHLRVAPLQQRKAKDLLRASRLALLPDDNPNVRRHMSRMNGGKSLSPVLLVRGDATRNIPLHVADGYHRVCAAYWLDENTAVACRIAEL